jgi:hypothetical protein
MAACFIFKGPLKVISKPSPENARTQGKPPFSHVRGHFRGDARQPDPRTSRTYELPSNETPAVGSHSDDLILEVRTALDPEQRDLAST